MGGATRVVQAGIGLVAELKAAKNEQKASSNQTRTATDSIEHRDRLLAEVQQLRLSASETETNPLRRDQLKGEIAQLRIKQTSGSSTSSSSSSPRELSRPQFTDPFASQSRSSSDHFRDDQPPLYAVDTVYPDDLDSDSSDSPPPYTPDELADIPDPLSVKYPSPNSTFTPTKLQHPVIIPQRRPGSKTRGFLRAYAPILADHDIEQETFLTFLKSFHKASQASPILTAITLGAGSLGQIPEPGSMLLGLGVTMLSGAAENLQQRYRTNAYLDVANEKLFKPRGLDCLIMSFRPGAVPEGAVAVEAVDTSKHAMKWLDGPSQSTFKTNYRNSSGTTNGELELPQGAALVVPEPDAKLDRSQSEKKGSGKNGAAYSKRKVAANYFDKRAQAAYVSSSLASEEPHPKPHLTYPQGLQTPHILSRNRNYPHLRLQVRRSHQPRRHHQRHRPLHVQIQARTPPRTTVPRAR